jgi:uncharacterized protein (TIGR02596 family)
MNPTRLTKPHAFTLVEVLFVMAIVIMLFAAAASGAKKAWGSQELKASAIRLSHDLALASQTAVKLNQTVQVRFYKYEGIDNAAGTPQFQSYQMVVRDPASGMVRPLLERQSLDGSSVLSSFPRFSSVLAKTERRNQEKDPNLAIGDYEYASVEFRPNGRTNLDPAAQRQWTLTLIPPAWTDRIGELPPDFQTLSIEPLTGAVRLW